MLAIAAGTTTLRDSGAGLSGDAIVASELLAAPVGETL